MRLFEIKTMTLDTVNTSTLLALADKNNLTAQNFKELNLSEIGLKEEDYEKVVAACNELVDFNHASVSFFGQGLAQNTQQFTDELLTLVQNKDLDQSGKKLDEVLKVAKGVNAKSLLNNSNKKFFNRGILGRIFGNISNAKDSFISNFNTTKQQLDGLIDEIAISQTGLVTRISTLESMHETVTEEYAQLGIYIAAGEIKLKQLALKIQDLSLLRDQNSTNELASEVFDLNAVATSLEKRVHDLKMLQQSALQTMPMIRVIQSNNAMLVDKFNAIKTITLPAWKTQFTLALSLNEQKNAVELATAVDDATNELLRSNADLLKINTIATAKANQRSVIDISTLEYVQNSLIQTVTDVSEIQRKGMQDRDKATIELKQMQQNLNNLTMSNAMNNKQITSK